MGDPRIGASQRLLDKVLSGTLISAEDIDELLAREQNEDLYLEFKSGEELKKGQKAAQDLRQYVAGFANSAGGLLLVGVAQRDNKVDGCVAPGGGSVADWASRCLVALVPYLSPPPRIQEVRHPAGSVLAIAVNRAPLLVPVVEGASPVYYLRLHDQTVKAPEYLLSDLILGHRQNPVLKARAVKTHGANGGLVLSLEIDNHALSWAEDVRVGIVAPAAVEDSTEAQPNSALLAYLDVLPAPGEGGKYALMHRCRQLREITARDSSIPPLGTGVSLDIGPFVCPFSPRPYRWFAGAYALARNASPAWFQIHCTATSASPWMGVVEIAIQDAMQIRPQVGIALLGP